MGIKSLYSPQKKNKYIAAIRFDKSIANKYPYTPNSNITRQNMLIAKYTNVCIIPAIATIENISKPFT